MGIYSAAAAAGAILFAAAGPAAASHVDLSGVWAPTDRNIVDLLKPQNLAAAGRRPPAIAVPPYKPEWAARYQERVEAARAGKVMADPTAKCLPAGMPRTMSTPFPIEVSVEPNRVLMLFEAGGVRWIPTRGAKHIAEDDLSPTFMGDSVGHWEGDTLVVDTIGLRGDTVFDSSGTLHSDKMHVVERIRLLSRDKLEDHMTIEDPEAFTKPWELVHTYDRKPDWRIMEFVCEENNRGINPDGSDAPGR